MLHTYREAGLLVHGIEPDGRVALTGLVQINDVIVEINGRSLLMATFERLLYDCGYFV